jgi:hypothetical protein
MVDAVPFSGRALPYTAWLLLRRAASHCRHELLIFFDLVRCEERRFREDCYQ